MILAGSDNIRTQLDDENVVFRKPEVTENSNTEGWEKEECNQKKFCEYTHLSENEEVGFFYGKEYL